MDKTYQPDTIESHWYQTWESKGYFKPSGDGDPYSIVIPPPNVTGSLHMGHGFQEAIMDGLIRYARMQGHNTLWQVGTDHAGIATQMVVERQLDQAGESRLELGREEFIKRVWEWKEKSGGFITGQLRRLGASPDWSRERFTMDAGFNAAVQDVFVQLYEQDLIYRGNRLVNWDPELHTAISDLEVISEEEDGHLWHFKYPLSDGSSHVVVATTRPETMLGDTAVAVHPDDPRFTNLVGKTITLPLCDREIPVIADDYVDMEFGSGCVKITPAHDFNDYEVGRRHDLAQINIFTGDAQINDQAPVKYQGMDRFAARKQIVADLDNLGLLEKEEPHKLKVPRGDRSGVVIEPYLTNQWYVKTTPLAKRAIEAVENGQIQFVPKQWENTYFSWMRDIQDWCISRQLWWGHRIPAWYDSDGNIYVAHTEEDVRAKYSLATDIQLTQDEDVLDTWFSSGLWSFATLGWPEKTNELKMFHPTNVLVTGFDIIFFWVARMIMMTLHFTDEVPFHTVYVHGLVRDSHGQKMSKSKGNVIDPIDLIDGIELDALVDKRTSGMMVPQLKEKVADLTREEFPEGIRGYGTDALRFTYYSLASTGRDINFDVGRIEGFRNFCNKIWNAARYVLMNTENQDCGQNDNGDYQLSLADRWIIARLQQAEAEVAKSIERYRFDLASQALYNFIWNEYCDWYLELSKPVLWDEEASAAVLKGTRRTLIRVLEAALRLAHPMMPFITEEIWQKIKSLAGVSGETIMLQPYPVADPAKIDVEAIENIEWLKGIIMAVRNIRGEMNISPAKPISVLLKNPSPLDLQRLEDNRPYLIKLAKLDTIEQLAPNTVAPASATQVIGDMELLVPMLDLIDAEAEIARLTKELDRLSSEVTRLDKKLGNQGFLSKAPANVVEKEQQKLLKATNSKDKVLAQIGEIQGLAT